ncbi:MAG: TldD/PmbA family protein, partial [Candidatus Bipolaricaulota bacterium]
MRDELRKVLEPLDADYADIRFEENRKTSIRYEGRDLRQIASYSTSGGHVRAYANGGKATASFSRMKDAQQIAHDTCASARLAAAHRPEKLALAPAPVLTGDYPARPAHDPRTVPLTEKHALVARYNDIILGEPQVATTLCEYDEFSSRRVFANTEGTAIVYDLLITNIAGTIVTRGKGVVQRVRFAFGGNEEFSTLVNREDELRERVATACRLLDAEPARAGVLPVVLDPGEAGVFIHEAFGHLSEADGLQANPTFREKLPLGRELGGPSLTVSDDPGLSALPGGYIVDDEGVEASKTVLIKEGILAGRLHSRETAAAFGEPPTGNMRAVDLGFTPLVRMSNIMIEAGDATFDDMVASIEDGYYLVGARGGQTSGDQFSFGAQWGFRIESGRLGPMARDINMSGELFSTLRAISMVGDDLTFGERGGCGKAGGGPMQL